MVGVGVVEFGEESDQFRDGYVVPCAFVCLQDAGYTAGVGRSNGDVDQGSFERGEFDVLSGRGFHGFHVDPTRMFSVEQRDCGALIFVEQLRASLLVLKRPVDCFLNEGAGILGLFRLFAIQVDVLTFIAQSVQPHRRSVREEGLVFSQRERNGKGRSFAFPAISNRGRVVS